MTFIQKIYWYLEDYSCVLVPRNKQWFNAILTKISKIWEIILKERKTGYDHRKPKRHRQKKKLTPNSLEKKEKSIKNLFKNSNMNTKIDKNQNIIIKVRTESFSET